MGSSVLNKRQLQQVWQGIFCGLTHCLTYQVTFTICLFSPVVWPSYLTLLAAYTTYCHKILWYTRLVHLFHLQLSFVTDWPVESKSAPTPDFNHLLIRHNVHMLIHDSIFLQITDSSHISCFIYATQLYIFLQHNQQKYCRIIPDWVCYIRINNIHPSTSNSSQSYIRKTNRT